jgi:glutathione S-transferase
MAGPSSLKPLTLWSHAGGPNPWKVAIILNELSLPYNIKIPAGDALKSAPYTDLNPNGRVPTIEDPNSSPPTVLWETGAIIPYLIATYDTEHKISHPPESPEHWKEAQWLAFQISGQGPYFGQAAWFQFFHPEKIPSAIERYQNEIARVNGVLDTHLKKEHGRQWLVGDKCTYADLAFVTWATTGRGIDGGATAKKGLENWEKWYAALMERESVKKAYADQAKAKAGEWAV